MIDYIKDSIRSCILGLYIYFFGVRFYRHPNTSESVEGRVRGIPNDPDIASLMVRVVAGYTITFKFSKEAIEYLLRRRGKTAMETSMVYSISAHYTESAPEKLKKFSTVRLCVPDHTLLRSSEEMICKTLMETYLGYIEGLMSDEMDELKNFRSTNAE